MDTDFYKEGESFHVNQHQIDRFNVTITSVTEMVALDKGYSQLNYMAIAMVLFNGLILFVGSAIMASRITRPIEKLTGVMSKYHKSKENHVFLDSNYPEFKQLQDGYNRMMVDIAGLFDALGKEQKVKRKAELRALQAQIKPHFLYNTFDSVCALALMEDHNRVYEIMSSLGQFYKLSLSKGNEVINLKEELEMVRHYLLIQKIRYPKLFDYECSVDESLANQPVLKLMLQPLVENALYHGLKPTAKKGLIRIKAMAKGEEVVICVEDTGAGMTPEQLFQATQGKGRGFGLAGTMERLRIYSGNQDVVTVKSEKGIGTSVEIMLKRGDENV